MINSSAGAALPPPRPAKKQKTKTINEKKNSIIRRALTYSDERDLSLSSITLAPPEAILTTSAFLLTKWMHCNTSPALTSVKSAKLTPQSVPLPTVFRVRPLHPHHHHHHHHHTR